MHRTKALKRLSRKEANGGVSRRQVKSRAARSGESDGDESTDRFLYFLMWHADKPISYSLYKMPAFCSGGGPVDTRPHRVAHLDTKHGMTFVSMPSTTHGSFIAGVGGYEIESELKQWGRETILINTCTEEFIKGPNLIAPKHCPVVVVVGGSIYALSSCPSLKTDPDYVPWFEVLDVSKGSINDNCSLVNCRWRPLPRPPCFRWLFTPTQLLAENYVAVCSYAAVDSYILLSIREAPGTYAFNVETEEWLLVDQKSLPFSGRAVLHGNNHFLGLSTDSKALTAYRIKVCSATVSIIEFRIKQDEFTSQQDEDKFYWDAEPLLSSMGNGTFCSLSYFSFTESSDFIPPQYARCLLVTYHLDDPIALDSPEQDPQLMSIGPNILAIRKSKQLFEIHEPDRGLNCPCVVGAHSI